MSAATWKKTVWPARDLRGAARHTRNCRSNVRYWIAGASFPHVLLETA